MNPEAIEAAAKTFAGYTPEAKADDLEREINAACRTTAKRVLEAAAPYLIQEARAAELEAAAEWLAIPSQDGGGFAATWLRTRAAAIRTGKA